MSTEIEIGGIKLKGGKAFAIITALSASVGALYGAFEFYKDYMDMRERISLYEAPDLSQIEKQTALAVQSANEAVEYTRDVKDDLRTDVIEVEKSLGQVEKRIRETERENRVMVKDAQRWFDERTQQVDQKLQDLESRLNKRVDRALRNTLAEQ